MIILRWVIPSSIILRCNISMEKTVTYRKVLLYVPSWQYYTWQDTSIIFGCTYCYHKTCSLVIENFILKIRCILETTTIPSSGSHRQLQNEIVGIKRFVFVSPDSRTESTLGKLFSGKILEIFKILTPCGWALTALDISKLEKNRKESSYCQR